MRRWWLLALASCGCAPWGWISSPRGTERLRSAWYVEDEEALVVVVADSTFPCTLPDSEDPQAQEAAIMDLYYAWYREGARVAAFQLRVAPGRTHGPGSYPLKETQETLDRVEPRAAHAMYHEVLEASLGEVDGLDRTYEIVDEIYAFWVEGDGDVTLETTAGGTLEGTFLLEALDVSGSFRATRCTGTDIVEILGLWASVAG